MGVDIKSSGMIPFFDEAAKIPFFGTYADAIISNVRLAVMDRRYKIIWVNARFCDFTSYREDELVGRTIDSLDFICCSAETFKTVFSTISCGMKWSGEIESQKKDGTIFWTKTTILPIKNNGKVDSYLILNSNITLTKKALGEKDLALERLKQSENRYRALVENQSDLISLCRADGTIIFVNESYCTFLGKTIEQLVGTSIIDLPVKGINPEFIRDVFQLTPDAPELSRIFQLENSTGKTFWVSLCLKGIFDVDGNLFEILTIGRNVTDLKNAELQKTNYIHDLEQIAFMTSHNVRGPIATMLGLVELLKMNAIHTEQWTQTLDSFKKCIVDLDNFTRKMSAFIYERQA